MIFLFMIMAEHEKNGEKKVNGDEKRFSGGVLAKDVCTYGEYRNGNYKTWYFYYCDFSVSNDFVE